MTPEQARILGLERKLPSMLMAIESLRRQLAAALQAIRDIGSGVGGGGGGDGTIPPAAVWALKARSTSVISAATSSAAPGSGTFIERLFSGTTKTDGTATGTCYSDHDVAVASGMEITVLWAESAWWVIDVASCPAPPVAPIAAPAPAAAWSPGPVSPFIPPY